MPKVSVVIPAYNAMTFLPITLESILVQTFNDYEVIIVNDGSSDEIETWAAKITDSRVKLVSQENQGLTGARNTGLTHAKGEYIAFLDADDLWEKTKLEKQVRVLDENPEVGLVYTWIGIVNDQGYPQGKICANKAEGDVWEKLLDHNIVECGSVAMVRRQCYEDVGFYDQSLPSSYAEDWDMWLRIAARYQFKAIQEPLVYYRDHANNLSSKSWIAMEKSYRIIIEKVFQSVSEHQQHLKNRCYGFANLRIAWKIFQTSIKEYEQVMYFRQQAVLHYPQIRYSREYMRLSIAMLLMRLFGFNSYNRLRNYIHGFKKKILEMS
jgi:glycosyltransferase involved in cell wall biosynthesis